MTSQEFVNSVRNFLAGRFNSLTFRLELSHDKDYFDLEVVPSNKQAARVSFVIPEDMKGWLVIAIGLNQFEERADKLSLDLVFDLLLAAYEGRCEAKEYWLGKRKIAIFTKVSFPNRPTLQFSQESLTYYTIGFLAQKRLVRYQPYTT